MNCRSFLTSIWLSVVLVSGAFGTDVNAESAEFESPKKVVEGAVDDLVGIVGQYPGEQKVGDRRKALRQRINPLFDFTEMAKRSLGANWLKINDDQRQEFVSVFSELLARTYLSKIENISEDVVAVDSEKIKYPKALVKTTITYKDSNFPLDYKLLHRKGNWKVYDVIIENIGLVANYRNEFSGIIRKEKFAGLIQKLKKKNS